MDNLLNTCGCGADGVEWELISRESLSCFALFHSITDPRGLSNCLNLRNERVLGMSEDEGIYGNTSQLPVLRYDIN